MKHRKIYLDGAANTPLDKKVLKTMLPYMTEKSVGNSHAIHADGIRAMEAVERARQRVANSLHVKPAEVYFTSGATESNNWVLESLAIFYDNPYRKEIVMSSIEHSSVLNTVPALEKLGYTVRFVDPDKNGKILLRDVKKVISNKTLLVCIMAVNNETGVRNNINYIGEYAHKCGAWMMSDCTQAFSYGDGYMNLKMFPNVDYFTFSGHKIYGPTGVGCLIVRKPKPLYPLLAGGSQENGVRGGTHNVAGIVGLGKACELLATSNHQSFYEKLYNQVMAGIKDINARYGKLITLTAEPTCKNIMNLNCSAITDAPDFASYLALYGVECSAGSACDIHQDPEKGPTPSHVLKAIKVPEDEISRCVRFSFTKYTTSKDIKYLIEVLTKIASESYNKSTKK